MRRNLYPLKKPVKQQKFAVCDIEARDWNQFLVIGFYDGSEFYSFETLEEFFDHAFNSSSIDIIYAHFGGIYDFLFLLNHVLGTDTYSLDSLIPRGSGLLSISIRSGARVITFRDSSALLPYSLSKLTKSFKVEHPKKDFDFETLTAVTPKLVEYLRYDCIGLYECLDLYRQNPLVKQVGLKITRSAQALHVFRTYIKKELPACPMGADAVVREAYAGGRTEIFRPFYDSDAPLYTYDVNSLYPSILKDFDMPTGFDKYSYEVDLERIGFGYFTVQVPEDTYIPILWTRESGKFIFPVGTFSGCFPLCEVKRAVEAGAKIIKSRAIAYFHNGGRYFAEYVETLYERRRRSTDEVERIIIKDLLNHLYGRMGLRLTREQLEFDQGQENVKPYLELQVRDKLYRLVKKEVEIKSFSNVAIAAWTTAQARLRLYDTLLKPCEKTIHYTDTDSGYTPQVLEVSDRLGDIKKESESLQACFLLPKTYIAGSKIAFKGFENRKVQHFKIDDFEAALNGDLRLFRVEMEARGLNKFKTGLRVGDLLSKRKATVKSIKAKYDKRIVFRDSRGNWETRPIILGK